jgi:Ca2+-binding EF-hand superfamily protein
MAVFWRITLALTGFGLCLTAFAQPPGGAPRLPSTFDPNWFFDSMDRNKDGMVTRDEIFDRRTLWRYEDYLRRAGITDGKLTREAFLKAYQDRMAEMTRSSANDAERIFRQLDRNNDGKIDVEEVQRAQRLRSEIDRWDSNKDGFIDLNEFRPYMQAFNSSRFGLPSPAITPGQPSTTEGAPADTAASTQPSTETKPPQDPLIVYRAGKLPPNLPGWFTELDTDGDGQVALHEWKGEPLSQFHVIDRNGDGIVTIEEAQKSTNPKPATVSDLPPVRIGGSDR